MARPRGRIPSARGVWLHAADPGLAQSLHVLAAQLAEQAEAPVTYVTGDAQAPGPGEDLPAMDAAFDRFQAQLLVIAGSRLPVPLIDRARARGVALMLVEAVNPQAGGGWWLMPGHTRGVLSRFAQIHARDAASAAAITRSVKGAVPVFDSGQLARHAPVPGCNIQELDALRHSVGARPVWLAHGLPEAEAEAVFVAHSHALRRAHRLLLIIEPRDLSRGEPIAALASAAGFICARRSNEEEIDETTQIYVADTGDDPGLFLRLAPVTYLGGSLTQGIGTPAPVTPAALGSALIFGPHASEDARVFLDRLRLQGGGRQIPAPADLGPALSALLVPDAGAVAALRAWTLATDGSDATFVLARAICDWLVLNGGPS
ncbi:MAG: 3-deoxy-D-manno-octulosonic acid transferase [Pararhodobacter sp.]